MCYLTENELITQQVPLSAEEWLIFFAQPRNPRVENWQFEGDSDSDLRDSAEGDYYQDNLEKRHCTRSYEGL